MKAQIESEIKKTDGLIVKEHLRTVVHLAKTDQDIALAIKAIRKYYTQKDAEHNFGSPLMRLLFVLDKTDRALELYFSEVFYQNTFEFLTLIFLSYFT